MGASSTNERDTFGHHNAVKQASLLHEHPIFGHSGASNTTPATFQCLSWLWTPSTTIRQEKTTYPLESKAQLVEMWPLPVIPAVFSHLDRKQ